MGKGELVAALATGPGAKSGSTSNGRSPAKSRSASSRSTSSRSKARRVSKPKPPTTSQRSIWSGAITFGLITIPVGLYTATEDRDIAFHQLSGKDKARIEYKRVSAKSGREVDWDDVVKGY